MTEPNGIIFLFHCFPDWEFQLDFFYYFIWVFSLKCCQLFLNLDNELNIFDAGGMQDYNYLWHGCMEVTLEISCCKYPPAVELHKYWQDNKEVNKLLFYFFTRSHNTP